MDEEFLYRSRMKICKECPLYKKEPITSSCNEHLYMNEEDLKTTSKVPKPGFKRGCGCNLERKTRLPNSKCSFGKW